MTKDRLLRSLLVLYALAIVVALTSLLAPSRLWQGKQVKGKRGSVAVLHVYGPIQTSMRASAWGSQDADDIARKLHKWSEDDNIKAIVLRINSPGGTVGGVQEIYAEILRCKGKGKKIVASLGDVAASGGYYLAAAADKIVANPGTITGSVGVILQFGNLEGLFSKLGVRLQVIKSGEHKDIGSPARSLTPEERRLLQSSIDDAYDQFVNAIAAGRGVAREKILPFADGRIFTGRQAQTAGLVDQLGNSEDAKKLAIELAGLSPNAPVLSDSPKSFSSLIKHLSSQNQIAALTTSLGGGSSGFSLEYSLR